MTLVARGPSPSPAGAVGRVRPIRALGEDAGGLQALRRRADAGLGRRAGFTVSRRVAPGYTADVLLFKSNLLPRITLRAEGSRAGVSKDVWFEKDGGVT